MINAFSRCDATSRIHSEGKPAVLEKYQKSNQFQKLATIFLVPSANKRDIIDAGEQRKRRQWMRSVLPTTTRSLEDSLLSNLSHLDSPQMPLRNTQKGSITLFKVGAEMINGDGKCRMGCAYLCK